MQFVRRPAPFVLIATGHGTMIVNRNDYRMVSESDGYGVGYQLMQTSWFDPEEAALLIKILRARREHYGSGVVAIDAGANIGTLTVELAKACHEWGTVLAIEAQERVFYALAGNLALNNCANARAFWAAVGDSDGEIAIPVVDYTKPASFGSLELVRRPVGTEDIGQPIDYGKTHPVRLMKIDSLGLTRLDLLKIDVEGMEFEALAGAAQTIGACKPVMLIEHIKVDVPRLEQLLTGLGYRLHGAGINVLAIHSEDPTLRHITAG